MTDVGADWQVLVVSLPTSSTALRMRLWRAIKAMGGATLRDGVYLMPAAAGRRDELAALAAEAVAAGGSGEVLAVAADGDQAERFHALFDRGADYAALLAEIEAVRASLAGDEGGAVKRLKALRRSAAALAAIDFFPTIARETAEARLAELEETVARALSPGEPGWAEGSLRRRVAADYAARVWVTRRNVGIDRLASAWLIRGFIDPEARFLFLDQPQAAPPEAVGFDFDGAEFTHLGGRVSFETLVAAFGLDGDPQLIRIGRIVHALDVGGITVPEAAGVEAVVAGLRRRIAEDEDRLAHAAGLFDNLYQG